MAVGTDTPVQATTVLGTFTTDLLPSVIFILKCNTLDMLQGKKQAQGNVQVIKPNEMQLEVRQLKAAIVNVGQIKAIYDVIYIDIC